MNGARERSPALRSQAGFTLIELMVAVAIGTIVVLGGFAVLDASVSGSHEVFDRTDSAQRGRLAMDGVMATLHSQTCPSKTEPPIADARAETITFYAAYGGPEYRPDRHSYELQDGKLTQKTYVASGTGPWTWPSSPTSTRVLATQVEPVPGIAMFRYYAFTTAEPIEPTNELLPSTGSTLSASDRARTVKVAVAFRLRPGGGAQAPDLRTTYETAVVARTADPLVPTGPVCE